MTDWDLFDTPAPLINIASRALLRLAERQLKPLGFSAGQVPVLYLLRDGGTLSQTELARLTRVEQPSMAQMLARMERDGLIRRIPDPQDRRSSLISLTEATLTKLPALREALQQGRGALLQGFGDDEVAALCDLLRRLNQTLDRMIGDRAP